MAEYGGDTSWIPVLPSKRGITLDIAMGDASKDNNYVVTVMGTSGCNSIEGTMVIIV